jgi:hypothetical protein
MNETDLLIQLVLVTPDDRDHEVWAALTSSEEAISRVLAAVPTGWSASLLDIRVHPTRARSENYRLARSAN